METTVSHINPPTVFKMHFHISLPSTASSSCRLFPFVFQTKASQKQLLLYFQKCQKTLHTIIGIKVNIKSIPSNIHWAGTRLCAHLYICYIFQPNSAISREYMCDIKIALLLLVCYHVHRYIQHQYVVNTENLEINTASMKQCTTKVVQHLKIYSTRNSYVLLLQDTYSLYICTIHMAHFTIILCCVTMPYG